jgi:adenylate cyclase
MESNSVRTRVTSGCAPDNDVRQAVHVPHPPELHCNAAANARAALERPEPGGPVNSQA